MTPLEIILNEKVAAILEEHAPGPEVKVWIVDPGHYLISQGSIQRTSMAVRNTDGEEFVLINSYFAKSQDIEQFLEHEASHLIAWRLYGEQIKEHGYEFLKVCRAVVTKRQAYFCKKS